MTCLIVFSHLRWGFVYQRPQHLLTRLAPHFKVFFIEEPTHADGPARIDAGEKADGLEVLTPRTPVEAPGFHDDQLSALKPLLAEFLRERGIDDYLVWFYTPMALPLIAQLRPRAVVYDCMDELAAFKDAPRQLRQRETALMKLADVVLAGGPALFESKRALHANVHCLPSSVDAAHFAPARLDPASPEGRRAMALQGHVGRPRLGFFGVIDERFDVGLLDRLAAARPAWRFVMVGPVVKIDPARLPVRANVHWLGMQPYEMLPHLMAGWDVCLMPFALNESTRFISPTKTLEYLAGGKPVVSTPVRDVVGLYGDAVAIADGAAPFLAACEAALAESPAGRADRLARSERTVAGSSWDRVARRVHELLLAALADSPVPAATLLRDLGVAGGHDAAPIAPGGARSPKQVRHLVVGAGPTGLAAACHLARAGAQGGTLLVEREEAVGGGWRPVVDRGYRFDGAGRAAPSTDPHALVLGEKLLGSALNAGGSQASADGFLPWLGCELACKTSVLHVSPSARTVRLDDGRLLNFGSLISTMPLPLLVEACGDEAPPEVRRAAKALRHVSMRKVNLGVELDAGDEPPTDERLQQASRATTVFDRIVVQGPETPRGIGLTCEIVYSPGRPLPCDGAALVERVVADCRSVGIIGSATRVPVTNQVDVPYAGVVDDSERAANVATVRAWFAPFGVVLAGRYGEWEDRPGDHPFSAGRRAAEQVLADDAAERDASLRAAKSQTG